MDTFSLALLSDEGNRIPDEYDWFRPLLGDWYCDYYDEPVKGQKRHVRGEWKFRRILEGIGIQDIFIFPSRDTREVNPQPDGEYGTSLRVFNKSKCWYDVVYTCEGTMKRLTFTKENDKLVGKVLDEENTYWVFSDISDEGFHWEYIIKRGGETELVCEIFGARRTKSSFNAPTIGRPVPADEEFVYDKNGFICGTRKARKAGKNEKCKREKENATEQAEEK